MAKLHQVLGGCKVCGKRMLTRGSTLIHRTCDACKAEQRRERSRRASARRKAERHAAKRALPVRRCNQCGEPMKQPLRLRSRENPWDRPRWERKFCSGRCRQAAFRDRELRRRS